MCSLMTPYARWGLWANNVTRALYINAHILIAEEQDWDVILICDDWFIEFFWVQLIREAFPICHVVRFLGAAELTGFYY